MGWFCHKSHKTCSIKHICPECLSQGFQSGCDRQLLGFGLPVKSESQRNAIISEQQRRRKVTFTVILSQFKKVFSIC